MKKKEKSALFTKETLAGIFQWNALKGVVIAATKGENWRKAFSGESLKHFFGPDWTSVFHFLGVAAIVTCCIMCHRNGVSGGKTVALGAFVYFNVFVTVCVARNSDEFEWPKTLFSLLTLWVLAIPTGIIFASLGRGFETMISTFAGTGVFAVPLMLIDGELRNRIVKPIISYALGLLGNAFSGDSIEDLAVSVLINFLGIILLLVILLCSGGIVLVFQYAGRAIGLASATGGRFARREAPIPEETGFGDEEEVSNAINTTEASVEHTLAFNTKEALGAVDTTKVAVGPTAASDADEALGAVDTTEASVEHTLAFNTKEALGAVDTTKVAVGPTAASKPVTQTWAPPTGRHEVDGILWEDID
ncbi:MAG: hypothetical protein IJU44_05925 [Kiritimatiellae bacterium]|nr:hypothetical protein [Kiritimatiellia bacterium]